MTLVKRNGEWVNLYATPNPAVHGDDRHGDLPYVSESGDTVTGTLKINDRLYLVDDGGDDNRIEHRHGTSNDMPILRFMAFLSGTLDSELRIVTRTDQAGFQFRNRDVRIFNALDVDGPKNARITHPDDPTRAFRFAATESNTPGVMEVYCGVHTVPVDRQLTLRPADFAGLPDEVKLADYIPIGRNPRVRLDSAGPREDSAPNAPYAWAEWETADPRIEIRAPAGDYHVELRFVRADVGVADWQHEVEVAPDDDAE